MRIVSLVPSWTETLLEAGVDVIGRTRYCIHPAARVASIPIVGGTKKIDRQKLDALEPDYVLVDKEENTSEIGELAGDRALVTHVESAADVERELLHLAQKLESPKLGEYAGRWRAVLRQPIRAPSIDNLPGVIEWLSTPGPSISTLLYLIWNEPLMAVSRNTYIGSVLDYFGYGGMLWSGTEKYPRISLTDFDRSRTLLLFSSEPYPFARRRAEIAALGFPCALVDGEAYSWFGIRGLEFLERAARI